MSTPCKVPAAQAQQGSNAWMMSMSCEWVRLTVADLRLANDSGHPVQVGSLQSLSQQEQMQQIRVTSAGTRFA